MKPYLATGSSIERLVRCPSSIALPHVRFETPYSNRGTAIHAFFEDVARNGREAALAAVDDEYRDVCWSLNLDGLDMQLQLAAEVALAYDCIRDTGRELGRGQGRIYDDVTSDEIPCALDVVGVKLVPAGRRGLVIDWKTGWTTKKKRVASDWQVRFGALAAARTFDLDIVDVQLIHVSEDMPPWIQRGSYSAFAIEQTAAEVQAFHQVALNVRDQYLAGETPKDFNTGEWCDYCPAKTFCPAWTRMLRAVIAGDAEQLSIVSPMTPDMAGHAWREIERIEKILKVVKGQIYGLAKSMPVHLGETADGMHRWLCEVLAEGNESFDGDAAYEAVAEVVGAFVKDAEIGERAASEATKLTTTKKDIAAAVKGAVPRGKGAKVIDEVHKAIRERGGARKKVGLKIEQIITKDATAPAPRALPAAEGESDVE